MRELLSMTKSRRTRLLFSNHKASSLLVPARLSNNNLVAVVDVDAGGGGDVLAHGLAHQVVVVVVILARPLVSYHLVEARHVVGGVAHALVDNLAVLDQSGRP